MIKLIQALNIVRLKRSQRPHRNPSASLQLTALSSRQNATSDHYVHERKEVGDQETRRRRGECEGVTCLMSNEDGRRMRSRVIDSWCNPAITKRVVSAKCLNHDTRAEQRTAESSIAITAATAQGLTIHSRKAKKTEDGLTIAPVD